MNYYVWIEGEEVGPLTQQELLRESASGNLVGAQVRLETAAEWMPAAAALEMISLMVTHRNKSRIVYQLLALFLGAFGIHHFYIGRTRAGCIQIVCAIIFFWTGFVPIIFALIALAEIFTTRKDAEGNALV